MSLKFSPSNGTVTRTQGAHGRNQGALLNFLCLLCFPPRRFSSQGRRPQNGSASTGKLNYFSVRCGNRSMQRFADRRFRCARIPPDLRSKLTPTFSGGNSSMKRFLTVSLCLLALTCLPASRKPPKPTAKKSASRRRSRQSLSAENLGWLVHPRSRQRGQVLRQRPAHLLRHRSFEIRQLGGI